MKNCTFCEIAAHEKPSVILYEDDKLLAFLDVRPLFPGHALLIPKEHYETFYDLPQSLLQPFFSLAQILGKAIEKGMEAEGSFIAMNNKISQSVPHLHIHIVPRNFQDGLKGFFWPRNPYQDERHKEEVQTLIKKYLSD